LCSSATSKNTPNVNPRPNTAFPPINKNNPADICELPTGIRADNTLFRPTTSRDIAIQKTKQDKLRCVNIRINWRKPDSTAATSQKKVANPRPEPHRLSSLCVVIRWDDVAALKHRAGRPRRALWSSRAPATFTGHWRSAEMPCRKLPLQQDRLVCARSHSHISEDVTATFRAGAVPPVLRWQYQCNLVYGAFTTLTYLTMYGCSRNDFPGPTGPGNADGRWV
jgi:hypothetical protein